MVKKLLLFHLAVLQTTLSSELPMTKHPQDSDGYPSRSSGPQTDGESPNGGEWIDYPQQLASQEPGYYRDVESQGKHASPAESDDVNDFEVLGKQPMIAAKRYLCRQSFVYNPVSGRCQPSLSVRRCEDLNLCTRILSTGK